MKNTTCLLLALLINVSLFSQTEFGSKSAWYMGAEMNSMIPKNNYYEYRYSLYGYASDLDYLYQYWPKARCGGEFNLGRYFKIIHKPGKFSFGIQTGLKRTYQNLRYKQTVTDMLQNQIVSIGYDKLRLHYSSAYLGLTGSLHLKNSFSPFVSLNLSNNLYYSRLSNSSMLKEKFASVQIGLIKTKNKFSFAPYLSFSKMLWDMHGRFYTDNTEAYEINLYDKRNYLFPSIGMNVYYHHSTNKKSTKQ
ncbi:MAG: hypothetical protein V2A54_04910 [Bacteroidota bacterium]